MYTPSFNSTPEALSEVRLYTELDPYFYTVDNRPLQDICDNVNAVAKSADAGRRGTILESMKESAILSGLMGTGTSIVGFDATVDSTISVAVSPGCLFTPGTISAVDTRAILRSAPNPTATSLSTPPPENAGKEITYLIQAKFTEFSDTTEYSGFDTSNPYLKQTLLNGYAVISAVAGSVANTGRSTIPGVTPGCVPLYYAVCVSGFPPALYSHPGSPGKVPALSKNSSWITPVLGNSWVNATGYQPIQYKRIGSKVVLRGSVQSGIANLAVFTLPDGFRPVSTYGFTVSDGASVNSLLKVSPVGLVTISSSNLTHLGTIEFYLD